MKREFLKLMGLDKLVINRIMAVYSADVERYKRENAQCCERIRSLESEASRWEAEANRLARELYYAGMDREAAAPCEKDVTAFPHAGGTGPQCPFLRPSEQDDRRKLD